MKIKLIFEDGKVLEAADAEAALKQLKKAKAVALRQGDQLFDLGMLAEAGADASYEVITPGSKDAREILRHSASHIMAHAVKELYPEARLAIGPSTDDGFYYDFDLEKPLTPEDLQKIEKKMSWIIKKNSHFNRQSMPRDKAIEFFKTTNEPYKAELLGEIEDQSVTLYEVDGFTDLCRGPHVRNTSAIKAFKLLSVAGAYWRGDEKNKMLQRIYGTAFFEKDALREYLEFLEEVKKRDHRKLGRELDLFSMNDEVGPGLVLWHPNGAIIRSTIEDFWRSEHEKAGYSLLYTPHMAKLKLWEKSGHWDFYRENMYSPMEVEGLDYEIKPMNCPFHIYIYKSTLKSYRDLPLRFAELGTVYRYERSGVLHGLLRVRGFTQDDAHIFATPEQIEAEIQSVLDFTLFVLNTFGFESYDIYLSTRPEKYVGSDSEWEVATEALRGALISKGVPYEVDPGEGVFYGPKIDIKVKDSLGRSWQCSTIQVDFNLPERFDVTYRGKDGREHRPIMIHRALMGSLERFFGILIEHYAGAFPLWLAPRQVVVMSISEKHADYALGVVKDLKAAGIRASADLGDEKIGYKIRQATITKVPYMVIIGDKEVADGSITVRKRSGQDLGAFKTDDFAALASEEISSRR